jgi:hypothetical protein
MPSATPGTHAAPPQGRQARLPVHVQNIYRLVIKELRSIRADPMMLILVAYAFSVAVYTVATGASTEARDLTVGVVDEDHSDLSRRLLDALNPPLNKRSVLINANEIDANMDKGRLVFVMEIPPRFETDLLHGRQASLQLNIDATAMSQAGNGAIYIESIILPEIAKFLSGSERTPPTPVNVVINAKFNPNLYASWFSSVMQVINNITMLAVILTGAALIREREQGTVEHLLVMPVVPAEIMLAKIFANALVILIAAGLSLLFGAVVAQGSDRGLADALSGGGRALRLHSGRTRHPARHANHLHGPVWTAGNSCPGDHAAAVGRRHPDGEHAGLAAICDADHQPDPAFRCFLTGRSLPRCRSIHRLALARRDGRNWQCLFRVLTAAFPPRDLRKLISRRQRTWLRGVRA